MFARKPGKVPAGQLLVTDPSALAALDAERVNVAGPDADTLVLSEARWPDILSKVLLARIIQSFENAGYVGAIGRTLDEVRTDHRLLISVREFGIRTGPEARATVALAAKLVDNSGGVIGSRVFRSSRPITEVKAAVALPALDEASKAALGDLVLWTCETI